MQTKFSLEDIKEFQERATIVFERGAFQHVCGLCYEIKWAYKGEYHQDRYRGFDAAYSIMSKLSVGIFDAHFGPYGEFTETRIMVLIFITTVSAKELLEMVNA